jgi:outer membrane protein assembly factor BamB
MMKNNRRLVSGLLVLSIGMRAAAQDHATTAPAAPLVLPGKGLAQHDFFYAGESRDRKMFIVKGGKIVWTYDDPDGHGEISDATLLSNGNVLLAHQFAVEMISRDRKVVWNCDAPKGCEIHTAIAVGKEHVLYIQNGAEPVLKVVNITTGEIRKQFPLPVKNAKSVHGQFRHARLTDAGTVMVAHMDLGKVCEYDQTGKEIWSYPDAGVWGVTPLKNRNLLIVDPRGAHEINRQGKTVWEVTRADVPDYKLANLQLAWRLSNGDTLINNWVNEWNGKIDRDTAPVQAIEVNAEKKVVWALREWKPPEDLGPATTIQLLDQPEVPENVSFGDVK